eukprot:1146956-Pelagomonas_calceolata.AAC.3
MDVASVLQPQGSRSVQEAEGGESIAARDAMACFLWYPAHLDLLMALLPFALPRWMGEPRFSWGGLCEVLGGRTYPLRAAVWPGALPVPRVSAKDLGTHPHCMKGALPPTCLRECTAHVCIWS